MVSKNRDNERKNKRRWKTILISLRMIFRIKRWTSSLCFIMIIAVEESLETFEIQTLEILPEKTLKAFEMLLKCSLRKQMNGSGIGLCVEKDFHSSIERKHFASTKWAPSESLPKAQTFQKQKPSTKPLIKSAALWFRNCTLNGTRDCQPVSETGYPDCSLYTD